jgi:DNA-directed RNA polymerase specialized sigma24 family protein
MTNLKKLGMLPSISVNGPGFTDPRNCTVPLPTTGAAEMAFADVALLGNIFYRGCPDCAGLSALGNAEVSPEGNGSATDEYYSLKEIHKIFQSITAAQKTRVVKAARVYAHKTIYGRHGHEDLLQEAVTRVLEDRRKWPRSVEVVTFLAGVMRSIASDWQDEDRGEYDDGKGFTNHPEGAGLDIEKIIAMFGDDPIAQKIIILEAQGFRGEELREKLGLAETEYENKRRKVLRRREKIEMFSDDPIAQKIIILEAQGFRGKELREKLGLTETEYDNKRKEIRRRLEKRAP